MIQRTVRAELCLSPPALSAPGGDASQTDGWRRDGHGDADATASDVARRFEIAASGRQVSRATVESHPGSTTLVPSGSRWR